VHNITKSPALNTAQPVIWPAPACQPYGAALFVDKNGIIITLTESTSDFFYAPQATLLLGQHLEDICPPINDVWKARVDNTIDPRDWTRVQWAGIKLDARAVPYQQYWLIDIWPAEESNTGWEDIQNIATIVREWLQHKSFSIDNALGHYCSWLGFDMAVVYHLEETGAGEIIAESKNDNEISLLGLHYPVSQLGNFSQSLGYQNVARNIVNIQAQSTKWWTIEPSISTSATELSVCLELDNHHAQMMKTLGFKAALMLPLVMDGNVKGLLIAYGRQERLLGGITLLVARTFAQSLSLKINENELRTRFIYEHDLNKAWSLIEHDLLTNAYGQDNLLPQIGNKLNDLVKSHSVMKLEAATQNIQWCGDFNPYIHEKEVRAWLSWLSNRIPTTINASETGVFATDFLGGSYDGVSDNLRKASGTLALRLPNKDLIVFTRNDSKRYINTSNKTELMHTNIRSLNGHATCWTNHEINNANNLLKLLSIQYQGKNINSAVQSDFNYDAVIVFAQNGCVLYMNYIARNIANKLVNFAKLSQITIFDLLKEKNTLHDCILKAMAHAYKHESWKGEINIHKKINKDESHIILNGTLRCHKPTDTDAYYSWTAKDITVSQNTLLEKNFLFGNLPMAKSISSKDFRTLLTSKIEEQKKDYNLKSGLLLLIDLDGTKNFIKTIGQSATNDLCQWLYRRLLHVLGENIQISHLGQDEFAIIVPEIENETHAWLFAETILYNIKKPVCLNTNAYNDAIHLTGCIGMAMYPYHANNAQDLLAAADNAMYAAKRAGKGQIRMHEHDSAVNVSQKFHLAGELRRAIQNNELRAYLQPQFNVINGEIIGAEALVRWQHPELGLLAPNMFIQVAEESGLIDKLGEWMLNDALRQLKTWPKKHKEKIVVSVNASVSQLRDKEQFLYIVSSALKKHEAKPENLEIEITETIWMGDNKSAEETLHALRKMGVSIAIDDFGTGYSNIAYLQNFPVDKLKFDRSFVIAGEESNGGKEILKAMVQLAQALHMDVLAEGVETKKQESVLVDVGIKKMQGYKYSRPLPEIEFLDMLSKHQINT